MDNNKKVKKEKQREFWRQCIHLFAGILFVALLSINALTKTIFFIITITAVIMYLFWRKNALSLFDWVFSKVERDNEQAGSGAMWYCLGCFLVVILFPSTIAYASILILAVGDSISHYIGKFYGKIPHPWNKKKNAEGTIIATIFSWLATVFFVHWVIGFVTAVIVMNLEVIEWRIRKWKINDNLWMPIVSGCLIWMMQIIF